LPVVINQANASPGTNVVQFGVTNALTLAFPLATITNNLTIIGRTDVPTVISGGGTLPIFSFAAGTTNILSQLVLISGNTTGGGAAINNAGTLSVSSCVMSNNSALSGSGGAVSNVGTLNMVYSLVCGNTAANAGGAVYNGAQMTLFDSEFSRNGAGAGGAIYNTGSLLISSSTISNNQAEAGGGVWNSGTLTTAGSTFATNRASGNDGQNGASGQYDPYFTPAGNSCGSGGGGGGGGSGGLGGGLFMASGTSFLTNCTFFSNISTGGRGGNGGPGGGNANGTAWSYDPQGGTRGNGGGMTPGFGGAGGQWEVGYGNGTNGGVGIVESGGGGGGGSTIGASGFPSRPGVGGGGGLLGGGSGGLGGMSSEITTGGQGGTASGGDGGGGWGAGIFAIGGNVVIVNCTIAGNECAGGAGGNPNSGEDGWGQAGLGMGGGIFNNSASVTLVNTVIAANAATDTSPDLLGSFTSSGFNLIGDNQGATGLSINDFQNVPANLGPLQDNGGPTLTCVPQQGSLAIGNGTSTGAPPTDQRGVPRPAGSCDIGAVQVVATAPYLSAPVLLGASGFAFEAIFDATNAYLVQASTNLFTWVDVTNYSSGGLQHLLDASATNFNRRFYRTVSP
jgi:hypothetical protein